MWVWGCQIHSPILLEDPIYLPQYLRWIFNVFNDFNYADSLKSIVWKMQFMSIHNLEIVRDSWGICNVNISLSPQAPGATSKVQTIYFLHFTDYEILYIEPIIMEFNPLDQLIGLLGSFPVLVRDYIPGESRLFYI